MGPIFYTMRYALPILTLALQTVYHVFGTFVGLLFVNHTMIMLNETGAEAVVYLGSPGDNTSL